MDNLIITGFSRVAADDLSSARLGARSNRMDLMSRLVLLAVEKLAVNFDELGRDRIAIVLAARAGSLATDTEFWEGRAGLGGPSPTVFTYTLASAPAGEIAIRHRLTGPNLCFIGASQDVLPEGIALLDSGEADGCVCVSVNVVTPFLAEWIGLPLAAAACAVFLQRKGGGGVSGDPRKFGRDLEALCDYLLAHKATS